VCQSPEGMSCSVGSFVNSMGTVLFLYPVWREVVCSSHCQTVPLSGDELSLPAVAACVADVVSTSSGGIVLKCPVNPLPLRRLGGGTASAMPGGGSVIRLPVNGILGGVVMDRNAGNPSLYM